MIKSKQKIIEGCPCSVYRIYVEIIRIRLDDEIEKRERQAGFRRGSETMDNVLILNHVVQRERNRKEGKVYAMLVDLEVAFDNGGREKLWKILEVKDNYKQRTDRKSKGNL